VVADIARGCPDSSEFDLTADQRPERLLTRTALPARDIGALGSGSVQLPPNTLRE